MKVGLISGSEARRHRLSQLMCFGPSSSGATSAPHRSKPQVSAGPSVMHLWT